MAEFEALGSGGTEAQFQQFLAYLFAQSATGLARPGVLTGLAVAQTTTASGSVQIGAGAGVAQDTVLNGATPLINNTTKTLDIFTSNPMGGTPRNDIVVFDAATLSIRAITGTPNAVPTDPTVPSTAFPLARLRHAASATTIPTAKIDDLRAFTTIGGSGNAGKRSKWGVVTVSTDGSAHATITHGAGFTPTSVVVTLSEGFRWGVDTKTSTTFRLTVIKTDGTGYAGWNGDVNWFVGE